MRRTIGTLAAAAVVIGGSAVALAGTLNDEGNDNYRGDAWKKATSAQRDATDITRTKVYVTENDRLRVVAHLDQVAAKGTSQYLNYGFFVNNKTKTFYLLEAHRSADGEKSVRLAKGSRLNVCRGDQGRTIFNAEKNVIAMSVPLSCIDGKSAQGDVSTQVWRKVGWESRMVGADTGAAHSVRLD